MHFKRGEIVEGKVTGVTKYGAFVSLTGEADGLTGMIHISEISGGFVKDINDYLKLDQTVQAVVLSAGEDGRLALSIKQMPAAPAKKPNEPGAARNFEDMINKFKRDSDEKMSDLKHLEPKKGPPRRRKD